MARYRVWLEDNALSYVDVDARSEYWARRKIEKMLDDDSLLDSMRLHLEQSTWGVNAVEPVR